MRSCLDFTANKFKKILFCLFEPLLGIFALSFLANRHYPLQTESANLHKKPSQLNSK